MAGLRFLREEMLVQISQDKGNIAQQLNNFNKMRKAFLCLALGMMSVTAFAQKQVTVKAGTIVPLQIVNPVKAADVNEGERVAFRVSRDINVEGVTAIPYGTLVNGSVYEAKRSAWFGTKGRLGIRINEIVLPSGDIVPLENSNVYVTGKNRTPVSILVFAFTLLPIPCGSKAEIRNGYEIQANVAASTKVRVE